MIQFLGIKTDDKGWKHFAWIATLNGIDIDYKTGLGHSKSPYLLDGARCIKDSLFSKPKSASGYLLLSVDKDQAQDMLGIFNMSKTLWNAERLNYIYVKKPKVREFYTLFTWTIRALKTPLRTFVAIWAMTQTHVALWRRI